MRLGSDTMPHIVKFAPPCRALSLDMLFPSLKITVSFKVGGSFVWIRSNC